MNTIIPIVIDILLVIIVITTVYRSYKRGFVRTVISFAGYLASAIAAFFGSKMLAGFIYNTFVRESLIELVREKATAEGVSSADFVHSVIDSVPDYVRVIIDRTTGGIESFIEKIDMGAVNAVDNIITVAVDDVIGPIVIMFISSILFMIIFAICSILINLLSRSFTFVDDIPVVGFLNSILAAGVGVIKAALYIFIISLALNVIIGITGNSLEYLNLDLLNRTLVLNYFYGISPLPTIKF